MPTRSLLTITLVGAIVLVALLAWQALRSGAEPRPAEIPTLASDTVKDLFYARGCVNCHDLRNPLVGPSFEAIAARYHGESQVEARLLTSLRQGSQGRWGNEAMPVHRPERLSDEEAQAMIRWILEQRPGSGN